MYMYHKERKHLDSKNYIYFLSLSYLVCGVTLKVLVKMGETVEQFRQIKLTQLHQ